MGKAKPKRHRAEKNNPTGLPSEAETVIFEQHIPLQIGSTVSSLLEKLQSPSVEERECACRTISHLISDTEAIRQCLQGSVVRIMGPLLVDKSTGVQQAALGALRNLSVDGGNEVCNTMVQQDVMTPLMTLLSQQGKTSGAAVVGDQSEDIEKEVLLQAVHLLWNLCESSSTAVKILTQQQEAVSMLLQLLKPLDDTSYPLALATAWCLYTVTENNPELASALSKTSTIEELVSLLHNGHQSPQSLLWTTLATGILQNVSMSGEMSPPPGLVASLTDILARVLSEDTTPVINEVLAHLANLPNGDGAAATESKVDSLEIKTDTLDARLQAAESVIKAQQVALEIITNWASDGDDDDEWEDESSDTSLDDLDPRLTSDMDTEVTAMETEMADKALASISSEFQSTLVTYNIVTKVLAKCSLPNSSTCKTLQQHRKTERLWKGISELQDHALLCTNNLLCGMELPQLGGVEALCDIWSSLSCLTAASTQESVEKLETVTCALRAATQKMMQHNPEKLCELSESDVGFLSTLSSSCPLPAVRAHCVAITSSLGTAMARWQNPLHPLLKPIGTHLCHVCTEDQDVVVVAEALDAIFDVFAEDHTDPVLVQTGLVDTLRGLAPALKAKTKKQRHLLGEHGALISTVRANLVRFIQYKSKRLQQAATNTA